MSQTNGQLLSRHRLCRFPNRTGVPGGRAARDQPKWRRFIHACLHACIQGLHCTTGTRRGKGLSRALDFNLLHYQPAAINGISYAEMQRLKPKACRQP